MQRDCTHHHELSSVTPMGCSLDPATAGPDPTGNHNVTISSDSWPVEETSTQITGSRIQPEIPLANITLRYEVHVWDVANSMRMRPSGRRLIVNVSLQLDRASYRSNLPAIALPPVLPGLWPSRTRCGRCTMSMSIGSTHFQTPWSRPNRPVASLKRWSNWRECLTYSLRSNHHEGSGVIDRSRQGPPAGPDYPEYFRSSMHTYNVITTPLKRLIHKLRSPGTTTATTYKVVPFSTGFCLHDGPIFSRIFQSSMRESGCPLSAGKMVSLDNCSG